MKRILIVDDFELTSQTLATALQRNYGDGVEILQAVDVRTAATHLDDLDLLLVDVILGGGESGLDLISALPPGHKTVVVGMSADASKKEEAMAAGADMFVDKYDAPIAKINVFLLKNRSNGK